MKPHGRAAPIPLEHSQSLSGREPDGLFDTDRPRNLQNGTSLHGCQRFGHGDAGAQVVDLVGGAFDADGVLPDLVRLDGETTFSDSKTA